jgi:hypothetical protein
MNTDLFAYLFLLVAVVLSFSAGTYLPVGLTILSSIIGLATGVLTPVAPLCITQLGLGV